MTPQELLQQIRALYPQYKDVSDADLQRMLTAAFPELQSSFPSSGQVDPQTIGMPDGYTRTGQQTAEGRDIIAGPDGNTYAYDHNTGYYYALSGPATGQVDPRAGGFVPAGYTVTGLQGDELQLTGPDGKAYTYNKQTGAWNGGGGSMTNPQDIAALLGQAGWQMIGQGQDYLTFADQQGQQYLYYPNQGQVTMVGQTTPGLTTAPQGFTITNHEGNTYTLTGPDGKTYGYDSQSGAWWGNARSAAEQVMSALQTSGGYTTLSQDQQQVVLQDQNGQQWIYYPENGQYSMVGQLDPATAGLPEGYRRTNQYGNYTVVAGPNGDTYMYDNTTGQYSQSGFLDPATADVPEGWTRLGDVGDVQQLKGPDGKTYNYNPQTGQYWAATDAAPGTGAPGAQQPQQPLPPLTQPGELPGLGTPPVLSQPGVLGEATPSNLNLELSPEDQAFLDQVYGAQRSEAMRNLTQAAQDAAAARGFRISDSPIGNAYIDEVSQLENNLGGQQAAQAIALGQEGRQIREASRQFDVGQQTTRFGMTESDRQAQDQLALQSYLSQLDAALKQYTLGETSRQAQEADILARGNLSETGRQFDTQSALQQWLAGEGARQFDQGNMLNQAQFTESVRQFQEGLNQQAFNNRLLLSGTTPGTTNLSPTVTSNTGQSGTDTGLNQALSQFLAALGQRAAGTVTNSATTPSGLDYWKAVNGTISSLGSLAGAFASK